MRTLRSFRYLIAATVLSLLALSTPPTFAAQSDSSGTEFWLMFNGNLAGGGEVVNLFITGGVNTTGTVEIPGLGFSAPFSVTAGNVTTITLPLSVRMESSDSIENKGVHVTAQSEVTVYGLNRRTSTTDAFLGLPVDILGLEYITQGYANVNIVNGTQFGLVAAQDATTVTITPKVTTGIRTANVPYNIVLNRGQSYQLRNTNFAPADLSGSLVTSDKPIAVFGSHQCANIPNGNTVACDHLVEQMTPTSTWGKSFVTLPLATRLNGDTFRIMASDNATQVFVDGVLQTTLSRGQFLERIITAPSVITADKPIHVSQYSNGTSFDGVTSDPFQLTIPPSEQFLAAYTITTPASGFSINFVNVIARTTAVGAVLRNGVAIPAADFQPIGSSGFSGAKVPVALGSHTFTGPTPFGLMSYGFDQADSYGYPGGLALGQVAELTQLTLAPSTATHTINTNQCVTATARDQNSLPLAGIRVDFVVTGVNPNSGFGFTSVGGTVDHCYTGANLGGDTISASVGTISANATKTWIPGQQTVVCRVDTDTDVDQLDLALISRARGQTAQPGDTRDADRNGVINPIDVKLCIKQCTRPNCAVQ